MRRSSIGAVIVIVWLVLGCIAASARGYFKSDSDTSCAKTGTVIVTVVAGPLNWLGVNPKIKCNLPAPSK